MDLRTYIKIYRKATPTDKVCLLIDEVARMERNYAAANEARIVRHNYDDAEYYESEARHMRERARYIRGSLMQDILDLTKNVSR